jgi:hypothetical protein
MNRIQRRRTKGYKLPPNCICINRGTKWGNPFKVSEYGQEKAIRLFRECLLNNAMVYFYFHEALFSMETTLKQFEHFKWISEHLHELEGHDLACFCPIEKPCHGDVYIELLNGKNK